MSNCIMPDIDAECIPERHLQEYSFRIAKGMVLMIYSIQDLRGTVLYG